MRKATLIRLPNPLKRAWRPQDETLLGYARLIREDEPDAWFSIAARHSRLRRAARLRKPFAPRPRWHLIALTYRRHQPDYFALAGEL